MDLLAQSILGNLWPHKLGPHEKVGRCISLYGVIHDMTKKLYLSFSRVAYGLCTEMLDSSRFSPILEGY